MARLWQHANAEHLVPVVAAVRVQSRIMQHTSRSEVRARQQGEVSRQVHSRLRLWNVAVSLGKYDSYVSTSNTPAVAMPGCEIVALGSTP